MTTRDVMNIIMIHDDVRYLRQIMHVLGKRERIVIEGRFGFNGEPQILDALATQLHCSRERVRQIQRDALKKLKKEFRKIDPDYESPEEMVRKIQEETKRKEAEEREKQIILKHNRFIQQQRDDEIKEEIHLKLKEIEKLKQESHKHVVNRPLSDEERRTLDRFNFISLFEYTSKSVKQLKRLVRMEKSIDERIRTVVAETHPELTLDIVNWDINGKYLTVHYRQPHAEGAYKRIDIYIPYFLASKESRVKLIEKVRKIQDCLYPVTIENLLLLLKRQF